MSGFVFTEKPIAIERGSGMELYDDSGTRYLDMGASYAVATVGHCHPTVVEAITKQAETLQYVQASYPTAVRTELYDRLAGVAPGDLDKVWLCNSGTEANEAAIKFARSATDRSKIVATMRGFHGRTLGALSATWKREYREPFEPLLDEFEFVPYGDADAMTAAVDEETAAVILEPVQGEGGIHAAPAGYLEAVRELTEATGTAMIVDEIQTGLGRTGTMWACEQHDIVPDIMTCAKGLASGLPIGTTVCADWIAESAGPHGSTFSGGPVVAAAANATLDVIESERLVKNAAAMGELLATELDAADITLRDSRVNGLMAGIEVKRGANRLLRDLAIEQQILALPAGRSVVRFLPPLVAAESHIHELVDGLIAVIGDSDS